MPAPETHHEARPILGHVNLMLDSFLANATADDLRAVVRATLATSPPSVTAAFSNAARRHLEKAHARAPPTCLTLFVQLGDGTWHPSPELPHALRRARVLYGAGMGFASLGVLAGFVRATIGMRWDEDSETADVLAAMDADITQAIQSSKEELAAGRATDIAGARAAVGELQMALMESSRDVDGWGADFPFERAVVSLQYWKL